ncbi:unnamed protein product [Ilex paraguariensis]|uniref:Uncharacterized protein n=1 Tax=Ilex paraguariensis TaxID=185542 RepID=A0ABC8SKG1_9AQUA
MTVQRQKSDTNSETEEEEKNKLLSENENAYLGQNTSADEKEASSSTNENSDAGQHDQVDSSSSLIPQEEKDALTDLATFPDTGAEGSNHGDAVSEP